MTNERELHEDLVSAMNSWTAANRSRSLSGLARRTGIAYSTIRRIAQSESVPHPYTALAIAEVSMTKEQRIEFLKKHFPTVGSLLEEVYADKISSEPNDQAMTRFLGMEPHNRIFNIAATSVGTTRPAIKELCGQVGLDALDQMIQSGVLIENVDGTIKYKADSWSEINVDQILAQIRHSTEHFDKSLVGSSGASLMHATASIKPELVPQFKEMVTRFIKEIIALKEDEHSEGNVHIFCDLIYSLYDRSELPNKN